MGKVRVGRRVYARDGSFTDPPTVIGGVEYTLILCLTKSTAYGSLGPYELFDEKGRCMENLWQASKVYESVPTTLQRRSRYDQTVIWSHPAEVHVVFSESDGEEEAEIQPEYFKWREKLQNAKEAIRYPVGFNHRHKCLFAFQDDDGGVPLDYIESRKAIYVPLYEKLVVKKPLFKKLKRMVDDGVNVIIVEVDGPHQESLDYYVDTYGGDGVGEDFIEESTMLATHENLDIMLNDPKHPYGHGYCLARLLIEARSSAHIN